MKEKNTEQYWIQYYSVLNSPEWGKGWEGGKNPGFDYVTKTNILMCRQGVQTKLAGATFIINFECLPLQP